ncbi:MAG TPA: alanine--tRNA ligase [Thermoanaerobaculia bacterium]|nr:alanine--tRNA ligase [Thermoanaerobaculia bacterium]
MPTTSKIREQFLSYFESKGHRRVPSSSLVPAGDPTLLFTNAGMNQFKDVFLGREKRDYLRATSSQKCVRAGGKHNDLENVGRTARHHTFFEMLGNFSFGDYFKKEAIEYAWELITKVWGLDPERLWFTVFEGDEQVGPDEEAAELWRRVGAPGERILRFGRKENFWQMGETGPCGPCSEIHYFRGRDLSKNVASLVNGEGDETMEIWNLVFMQYDRDAGGILTPLPAPSVDTGAGLARMATVLQKVDSTYDIDLFAPLIRKIESKSGHRYGGSFESELDTAVRVLCDHARAATFLVADGVIGSNEGRGYVLRRIIRRAIRFGRKLPEAVVPTDLVDEVIRAMGEAYPELEQRRKAVMKSLRAEEERFANTLNVGIERIGQALDDVRSRGERTLPGEDVFRLYDTYGIPVDMIAEMGEEEGVAVDRAGFEEMMKSARERAKAASKFHATDVAVFEPIAERLGPTEFVGWDRWTEVEGRVLALVRKGAEASEAAEGETAEVVVSPTPFYAESGGQIADLGTIAWDGGEAEVLDTQKPVGELIVSAVRVGSGTLRVGTSVRSSVPGQVRLDTTANHTATHLLHKALKEILGETVQQAGSLVAPDRLRFDYTWNRPLTEEETRRIEEMVNDRIRENLEVSKRIMPISEARSSGAVSMFGEKYGEMVRVVSAGGFSSEFCGGCHVNRTGDIGVFKIVSERSLASGVRRMEALTGRGALSWMQALDSSARELQSQLNAPVAELPGVVRSLQDRQRQLEKELRQLRVRLASAGGPAAADEEKPVEIDGIRLLTRHVRDVSGGDLRNLADALRRKVRSGVVLIGSETDGKATLLAAVTSDVLERVPANALIRKLAPIVGGKGGGKADLAQAGGKDPDRIPEALSQAETAVREMLLALNAPSGSP